ncbi:MAG TPA: sigma-70 family RNA polymerase sigma factor [Verrucomicrobiae bacterium]|nr:sigma-70 family RNA polymerase sigma factor [Verrucomicrobiae bacterium]
MNSDADQRALERIEETLWVIRARDGDAQAFARLLARHEQPLFYYLRRLIGQPEAALDAHQEVWLDAYRGFQRLRSPEAFRPWLYRIAHDKAARHVRREILERQHTEPLEEAHDASVPEGDDTRDPEAVHQALDRLPPSQREVLTLHYLRDLNLEEMAAMLGCPAGTIKSRLYHARLALRRLLRKESL